MIELLIDHKLCSAEENELLIEVIGRTGREVPHLCYHAQLGPIQTCDTCIVEVDGRLVRACATRATRGIQVSTGSPRATDAQVEAFDRILSNHLLYCTVCDNRLAQFSSLTWDQPEIARC